MIPRDVRTRWNATYDMLEFAYQYRKAINIITDIREMKLRLYEIEAHEWEIVRQLRDLLKVFKDATLFFSRGGIPNLASVIPAMDHLDEHLASATLSHKYNPAIRVAIGMGKKTLNRYYDRTDHSELYRIAMVLHPCHKLSYFQRAGWAPDWIATAKKIVRDEFDRSYRFRDDVVIATGSEDTNDAAASKNIFDNLPAFRTI
jgi:hypothetical protein